MKKETLFYFGSFIKMHKGANNITTKLSQYLSCNFVVI